ncbi:MAG: hypothetical protein RH946_11825 [Rhodospirillales bacterium]
MTEGRPPLEIMQCKFFALAVAVSILTPKAVTLIVIIAAIFFLYLIFRTGMKVFKDTLVLMFFSAICIWMATTSLWAVYPLQGLEVAIKVAGIVAAGWICFQMAGLSQVKKAALEFPLYIGAGVGVIGIVSAMLYALITDDSLWGSFFNDPLTTLNNSAVILALLLWPFAWLLWGRSRPLAGVTVGIWFVILFCLSSLAAVFSIFIGIFTLLMCRFGGRTGGIITAGAVAMILILAPYIVKVSHLDFFANPRVFQSQSMVPNSVMHRFAMWSFATEKIDENPWFGWGVGSSRHIPQNDRRVAKNMEIMPLHPHNMALQIRLELGVPGILLFSGLAFLILYKLATFSDNVWKCGVASATAVSWLFVANVSFGIWQSWWIATAFALAALTRIVIVQEK